MKSIKIETTINKSVSEVWINFNEPAHIVNWNFAHESWECSSAKNDMKIGGMLETRMQAKDGSFGFDFVGIYDEIVFEELIKYHLQDGRNVKISFEEKSDSQTKITEEFDPELENPVEMQQQGWQAILDQFKKYCESH